MKDTFTNVPQGFSEELEKALKAFKSSSKFIVVSMELLKDASFDVDAIMKEIPSHEA